MKTAEKLLLIDVETANSTEDALVYDVGGMVIDRKGTIYDKFSFIVSDIFFDEAELMKSAYYATKIPQYLAGIEAKAFKVVSFASARFRIADLMKTYAISKVFAYNASFDYKALNTTERWLTKSQYRFFFPYGTEICCIWHMACQTICMQKGFVRFALENGFVSPSGNIKTNAETVYAYLMKRPDFQEKHTGLEDVDIEKEILIKCFKTHKKMDKSINRLCWRIPQKQAKEMQKEG